MTAILTQKFRLSQAALFISGFDSDLVDRNVYVGIGRPNPWTNDLSPESPLDDVANLADTRNTLLALKRATESDVTNVIPHFKWDATGKTIYVQYDNTDEDLFNHPTEEEIAAASLLVDTTAGSFYAVTDDLNVYKCLYNNNGAKSTIKPTGTSVNAITTADGYIWKYMYTIQSSDAVKFLTDSWLPVRKLAADNGSQQWLVQEAAISGSIDIIKVLDGGSGYTKVHTGAVVSATSNTVVLAAGASAVDDFYNGSTIFIESGTGVGQSYLILDYVGSTKTVTVTGGTFSPVPNGTSVYNICPTVTITGNGSAAKGKAVVVGGEVTKILLTNVGTGYTFAEVVVQDQTGDQATARAILSPEGGHGADAIAELGGTFVMVNVKFVYNEGVGFPKDNDYRRIIIVNNLLDDSDDIAEATTLNATKSLEISSVVGDFLPDELLIFSGGGQAKYIELDGTTLFLFQDSSTGFGALTGTILGDDSAATASVDSANTIDINRNSGDIIYIEQRRPINRETNQTEDIKALIRF